MQLTNYVKNVSNIFPSDAVYYAPFDSADFRAQLVDYIMMAYSGLQIRPTLEDYVDGIPDLVISLLNSKKYSYTKLWETTQVEYDPIENYSMTESGTDTNTTDNTNNIGAQTNTSSINNSTSYGEVSNNGTNSTTYGRTEENGQSANTKSGGQTDSRYTVPYDTNDEQLAEKTKTDFSNIKDSATNKVTAEEHTDSGASAITIGAHTDTSKSTNSDTLGARIDTSNSATTTTHEFKRSGNIGVTTSQMMLQSERDIAMFNFMAIVAHDIIKLITICIYD